ncbi:uncharacterized protein JCM10292_003677 [Rhodotorula paludigena]|uniref:uncharacterized protein n=1 Tax=Rhodotorula paludigena TaxID=86838 RepID=UPI00317491F2
MPPDRSTSAESTGGGPIDRPLATSCTTCRSRKIKCDSARPVCGPCAGAGVPEPCEYRPRQKPGLKAGMSNLLMDRVSSVEASVKALQESGLPASVLEQLQLLERRVQELEQRGGSSALSAPAGSTPSSLTFHPPTLGYQHDTQISSQMAAPPVLAGSVHASPVTQPSAVELDLPPDDLLYSLIELFYTNVAPYCPIARREELQPFDLPDGTRDWPIPVYGVVVASLRFSQDQRWGTTLPTKDHFRERARNRIILLSMSTTSLATLQALALVALDDMVGNTTPNGWGALALLTRTASHMLLFQESTNTHEAVASVSPLQLLGTPTSFAEEEDRRRLFWSIFMLDRWSASATGWDFAFLDQQISRRLPASAASWSHVMEPTTAPLFRSPRLHPSAFASPSYSATSLDIGFTALIEVCDLLGHVHQLHRLKYEDVQLFVQETDSLEARLERWYNSLPAEVKEVKQDDNCVLVMALYWASTIKLLSLVAYPLFRNLSPNLLAVEKAHKAAQSIAALTQLVPVRSPYLAWSCFVAARMLVLRAHRRHEPIDGAIHTLGQALRNASPSCDLARRYLTLITRALQRLHSIDGTLGGAAALVDLHHTAFSAESAVLPSGAVTPVGYHNPADLSRLTEANGGAQYWGGTVTPRNGAAAGGGAELPAAPATGEIDMWLDNELLGHSFDSWFDIPQFTTAAAASGS